jgi:bacterial/archaeal transporter family protein
MITIGKGKYHVTMKGNSMQFSWIFFGLLSALFAAFVAIFGKLGVAAIDSTLATTVRAGIMFAALFIVSLCIGKFKLVHTIDSKAFSYIVLSALAGASSWLCYFIALKLGPASKVAALDRLSMVFVIFLAVFIGETLTVKSVIGAVLVTLGAVIISLK